MQLGMLLAFMVAAPLYAKYEDPVMAAVGLTLVGGVLFATLPAFLQGVAWVVVFSGLTVAVFTTGYRMLIR
jgi:hypothetical protein